MIAILPLDLTTSLNLVRRRVSTRVDLTILRISEISVRLAPNLRDEEGWRHSYPFTVEVKILPLLLWWNGSKLSTYFYTFISNSLYHL